MFDKADIFASRAFRIYRISIVFRRPYGGGGTHPYYPEQFSPIYTGTTALGTSTPPQMPQSVVNYCRYNRRRYRL